MRCRCGKGKASAYDNKCGHCRTRGEQWLRWRCKEVRSDTPDMRRKTQELTPVTPVPTFAKLIRRSLDGEWKE